MGHVRSHGLEADLVQFNFKLTRSECQFRCFKLYAILSSRGPTTVRLKITLEALQ